MRTKIRFYLTRKCHRCKLFRSVRKGSFFEASRISLQQHMQFLWKWAQRDSLRVMSLEGIASRKTLIKLARRCREVAWRALILHPIPILGGPGVIIQIDESKFNHKSKVSSSCVASNTHCKTSRGRHRRYSIRNDYGEIFLLLFWGYVKTMRWLSVSVLFRRLGTGQDCFPEM